MDYTVYFADKAVVFTAETPGEGWYAVTPAPDGGISRAKVTKILESYNKAAVVTPDPGAAFGAFAAEFALIEAAGGVVVNDCGQWLMIRRNGRWDLPKGHLECGERIEECAAREIEEETRRGGATPVRYAACLLFPQDRTLGAETHPLVRAAYGILCPACASGRRGD